MTNVVDREYRTIDKTSWGPGRWQHEPDKLQWVDETTELDCLIVRSPLGSLCGYVGVPPEHPWHGRDYNKGTPGNGDIGEEHDGYYADDCPGCLLEVHGGITYAAFCQEVEDESVGVCHVPLAGRPADVWWFGFDCGHSGDVMIGTDARLREAGLAPIHEPYAAYRTVAYVCASRVRITRRAARARRRVLNDRNARPRPKPETGER